MKNCIFCKILDKEIFSERLYEDDKMIIIRDIQPKTKLHYLAVIKEHYALLADLKEAAALSLGLCLKKIGELAPSLGLENGFRAVINQGEDGGQTINHLHVHILGGERLEE